MSLTRKADYALRAMIELTTEKDNLIPARQLAEKTQVPYAFMTKIISDLCARGLAQVSRGSMGGVRILADPKKTTALQVVESISGLVTLNQCVNQPKSCSRTSFCPMHSILVKAQKELGKALSVDLHTLANTQSKNNKPSKRKALSRTKKGGKNGSGKRS